MRLFAFDLGVTPCQILAIMVSPFDSAEPDADVRGNEDETQNSEQQG